MNKNKIRLTESQLHRVIKESVKSVLNEISLDTLQKARDKAQDDFTNISDDNDDFIEKRYRQLKSFGGRIHQINTENGRQLYYIIKPGLSRAYEDRVERVYMTPYEALLYSKEHHGDIYSNHLDAIDAIDRLS